MQTFQILGLLLPCMALYFTSVKAQNCNDAEKLIATGCVNAFVLLNGDAKNLPNTTDCRTDKLKEEGCTGWSVFKACYDTDCVDYTNAELEDSGMNCTYKEVMETCGASFLTCSLFTLIIAAILAMFN